ncbi:hypothetical protein P7D22_21390 [Lichenihabitans sp. Uapishka_5]|uniref:hypothetical protein n=1 Tax=Lichenihabitans sp. Uapishka_5 TaxID=3037302 RepID=UPI0029E80BE3|nr:hypothetical protein [Lichenihabitans sp. Uapishka_5]MDX7953722.1 hypothetical protein [Lichenihabitans sp. Uapishka_5]
MGEQRYSLEEAAQLLGGVHPNTVRARAAKGRYRYDKDNSGKWFVWLDPEKAANDRRPSKALEAPKLELEAPMEPPIGSAIKGLELTIQVLNAELEGKRSECAALQAKADDRTETAQRLEVAIATLTACNEASSAEIEQLRSRLTEETETNRRHLLDLLERMTPKPAKVVPSVKQSFWRRLFSSAA